MSIADIILAAVLLAAVAAAVAAIIIRKRRGKGCSCGCENCRFDCQKKKNDQ